MDLTYGRAGPRGPGFKIPWTTEVDGQVVAQPLVVGGHVLVATEQNSVYSLNATGGGMAWRTNLGASVAGTALPCGNVASVGITGTPVVDSTTGVLYAVAFLAGPPAHHELFRMVR